MAIPKVHSGARAILQIDDTLMIFATSVTYSIMTDFKEINTIDNSLPEELAPTNIKVEVRCSNLRVPKESATVLGLQPTILNHLHQKYVSIEIRDRGTNDTMLYVPKAMLVSREGSISNRQLAGETWVLKGIGFWDERTPQASTAPNDSSSTINQVAALSKKIRTQL